MNRTVCDSSPRENLTGCSPGVALHPWGSSSFTDVSAGPVVSFSTVTLISRSEVGAAPAAGTAVDTGRAAAAPRPAALPARPATVAPPRLEPAAPPRPAVEGRADVAGVDRIADS